ncbi:hypothetical protein KCU97_g16973, partial [Aureobasidium melanogenum]
MSSISNFVDLGQPMFWLSAASICFNPTFWNTAARSEATMESNNLKREKENRKLTCFAHLAEYHNKTITKLFGGNSLYGCYALAVTIFTLGIVRDS